MPGKTFYLGENKTQVLHIQWTMGWRNTMVSFNDINIETIGKEDLVAGKTIILPNGKEFFIRLRKGFNTALETRIDGKYIPGSPGDPHYMLKQIFILLMILGILNIVIGMALAFALKDDDLFFAGLLNAAFGVAQIALGFGIKRGFFIAQILATILMSADLVLTIYFAAGRHSGTNSFPMLIKTMFLLFVIRGFHAFKELKKEENNLI